MFDPQNNAKREYQEYLNSEEWFAKRAMVLRFWDYKCVICYSDKNLHLHHRTYARRGDENVTDLIPLCKNCHSLYHSDNSCIEESTKIWKLKLVLDLYAILFSIFFKYFLSYKNFQLDAEFLQEASKFYVGDNSFDELYYKFSKDKEILELRMHDKNRVV